MKLADNVAVITGGGSGIGRATALLFAREGATVVVAQRTESTGQQTVETIEAEGGAGLFIRTDVTKAAQVEHLVQETTARFGRLDILFNNAGEGLPPMPFEEIDERDWDAVYAVNVKGIYLGAKYAVPVMKKAGQGVIINTASIGGVRPRKGRLAYASSKAAAIMLTKVLALELAPFHIRVVGINPVITDTPFIRRFIPKGKTWKEHSQALMSTVPIGRMAQPEEIAHAALYLASKEAAMVTGTCLDVDGGRGV